MYDFIVNDLFHISVSGDAVTFDVCVRTQHDAIRRRFEEIFFSQFDRKETLFITAILFASMAALHYDAPNRQLAMFVRSIQLFDEFFASAS
jgi:hypothetical protein